MMMQGKFSPRTLPAPQFCAQPIARCPTLRTKCRASKGTERNSQATQTLCTSQRSQSRGRHIVRASGDSQETSTKEKVEFGYTRKDVIIIGAGLIGAGYALYYGVQAFGIEATAAGNYVQLFVFLVICLGYISTYIFRVANKDMTYAKQLEAYEERVMQKRLEEMPETERERLLEEVRRESSRTK